LAHGEPGSATIGSNQPQTNGKSKPVAAEGRRLTLIKKQLLAPSCWLLSEIKGNQRLITLI